MNVRIWSFGFLLVGISSAQAFEFGQDSKGPLEIESDQGIECSASDNWCEATGNVVATQGESILKSSQLKAIFQRTHKAKGESDPLAQLSQGLISLEATGNVQVSSPKGTATGSRAFYDTKTGCIDLYGPNVILKTETETLIAEKSVKYCGASQGRSPQAEAFGRSHLTKADKTLEADMLQAHFKGGEDTLDLDHVHGEGHVKITTPDTILLGDEGDYRAHDHKAILKGNVKMTRGKNQLNGAYGVMNTQTGHAEILGSDPLDTTSSKPQRVKALIIPDTVKPQPKVTPLP